MKKILTLVLLSISIQALMAQNNRLTPELLMSFGRIGNETVSPDGQYLAYTVTHYNIEENNSKRTVMLYNLETEKEEVLIKPDYNVSQIAFNADSKVLFFLSAKDGSSQVYLKPLPEGEVMRISKIEGGVDWFRISPDGKQLAFGQRVKMDQMLNEKHEDLPKTEARLMNGLLYRHWTAWHDYSYAHVFVIDLNNESVAGTPVDIMKGEKYHTPTMPFGGVEDVVWGPDSKNIYYVCKKALGTPAANSTNTDIYQYELSSGKTTNITEDNKGYDRHPAWSPDGSQLAWTSMERPGYESDKNRIILQDKKGRQTDLTADFKYSVDGFTWGNDGDYIYFIAAIDATHQVFALNVRNQEIRQITKGQYDYTSVNPVKSGKMLRFVYGRMSMSAPKGLYMDDQSGAPKQIDQVNTKMLEGIRMGRVEKRMIAATDSAEILTWVIYPPGFDKTKKYPTLLYCQGGPQSPVSQFFSYRWNFQMMAAMGYIVVAPNRRGLPGFGQEWNDAIMHDYGGQAMDDLLSAIDEVSKEPYVDKKNLGAVGASFGGYSVYWLAGNHNKRFRAFISHCGMFNMESWYGTTEEMFFANNDNGPYWHPDNIENYKKHSPHQYVSNWDTPILIIHNELDYRVPLSEGMQAFTAAQQKMIPSKFLYFPDEGHWVNKPQNAILWQREFFAWLDQWLK